MGGKTRRVSIGNRISKTAKPAGFDDNGNSMPDFDKKISSLSREDIKDLLLVNSYKLALTRAQVEALVEIIIKNKLATYEEIWKKTNEIFKNANPQAKK